MSRLDAEVGDIAQKGCCRTHAFLAGLAEAQAARVLSLGEEVTFSEGELVLDNGQRSTSCYLVLSGSVAVALATARLTVSVQVVASGGIFGWSALLQGQDTMFQVRARELTTALRIEGSALTALCREDPELGVELLHRVLRVVSGRVRATETVFAEWCGVRIAG